MLVHFIYLNIDNQQNVCTVIVSFPESVAFPVFRHSLSNHFQDFVECKLVINVFRITNHNQQYFNLIKAFLIKFQKY